MKLREYQEQAIRAVTDDLIDHKRALLVMMTGTGKTATACELINRRPSTDRVLVLENTIQLCDQFAASSRAITDRTVAVSYNGKIASADIIVSTRQTFIGHGDTSNFDLIIIDECHHAASSEYSEILKGFNGDLLGMTATPTTNDITAVSTTDVFGKPSFTYTMQDAVDAGYLVPPIEHLLTSATNINEASEDERQKIISAIDFTTIAENATGGIMVFVTSIRESEQTTADLKARGLTAVCVHSGIQSNENASALERFSRGEVKFIVSADMLLEGYDCPSVSTVVIARFVNTLRIFSQMVGRGLRIAHGKDHADVFTFIGADSCRVADIYQAHTQPEAKATRPKKARTLEDITDINISKITDPDALTEKLRLLIIRALYCLEWDEIKKVIPAMSADAARATVDSEDVKRQARGRLTRSQMSRFRHLSDKELMTLSIKRASKLLTSKPTTRGTFILEDGREVRKGELVAQVQDKSAEIAARVSKIVEEQTAQFGRARTFFVALELLKTITSDDYKAAARAFRDAGLLKQNGVSPNASYFSFVKRQSYN